MNTVGDTFQHLMVCTDLTSMADIVMGPLPPQAKQMFNIKDDELEAIYKASLNSREYFGAFSAAQIMLINALRREDYPVIYTNVAAMLFTGILDEAETAFVALALVWPIMAFCQLGPKPANVFTLGLTGKWIADATERKRAEGATGVDGRIAMLLFRSMSIFHILTLREIPGMSLPDVDPVDIAKEMEKQGLHGALDWVRKNS